MAVLDKDGNAIPYLYFQGRVSAMVLGDTVGFEMCDFPVLDTEQTVEGALDDEREHWAMVYHPEPATKILEWGVSQLHGGRILYLQMECEDEAIEACSGADWRLAGDPGCAVLKMVRDTAEVLTSTGRRITIEAVAGDKGRIRLTWGK